MHFIIIANKFYAYYILLLVSIFLSFTRHQHQFNDSYAKKSCQMTFGKKYKLLIQHTFKIKISEFMTTDVYVCIYMCVCIHIYTHTQF